MKELRSFRESLNLSPAQFAEKLGISKSLYEKVEGGFRPASRNFVERLKTRYPQFDTNIFFITSNH